MRLWDAASGKQLAVLKGHTGWVYSVAFSPDGSRLASGGAEKEVRLWDTAAGRQLAILEGNTGTVHSVAFSPDGGRLASGSEDGTVRLWDAASGKQLAVLKGQGRVNSVAFSPDGGRLTSISDKMARQWMAFENPKNQDKRRRLWREQQTAAAEKERRWFAAAFHLSRLIDANPAAAALYARRCNAEFHLGRWQPAAVDLLQALALWPADDNATSLR